MFKFIPADHSRRTPSWLQNRTKENLIWQIAMTGIIIVGFWVKDEYDERKRQQRLNAPLDYELNGNHLTINE